MPSDRAPFKISSIIRSPTLAVVVAYALRMFLLWLSHQNEGAHPRFQVIGLEEGRVAWSLATGKGFFGPFPGYEAVTAWLAPVYPFLWAICLKLTHLNSEALLLLAQTMNCAFSAATCWPIFSISKRLFGEKVGLTCTWVWVFLPYAILMPLEWTWDQSLSGLILALIVDATYRLRESMSPLFWSGYGLLWGFAALVNPTLCVLLPFFFAWLVYERRRSGVLSLALYARVALMFALAVLPWIIRNHYAVGGWTFIKSNFGVAMWVGNHPASVTMDPHPMNNFAERMRFILEGEADYGKENQRKAIAYIQAKPGEFLQKSWNRVLDIWSAQDDSWVDSWVTALHLGQENIWFCSAFSVLSFAGVFLAWRAKGMDSFLPAMCLLVFPIPYYVSLADLRYRHPIDPFMTIFSVYVLSILWRALLPRPGLAGPRAASQSMGTTQ